MTVRASSKKNPNFVLRLITNEAILVPTGPGATESQHVYMLNSVASRIWQLLDGERSLEDIAQALSDEFNVTKERALSDVVKYLEELEKIGAIEKV